MASCTRIETLFQAYIDGELGQADKVILEQHLSECSACVKVLEQQKATSAMLFEVLREKRLTHSMRNMVMAHLPEMEDTVTPVLPTMRSHSDVRTVAEVNWRAKHPRPRLYRTLLPVLAASLLLMFSLAVLIGSWPEHIAEESVIGMVTYAGGKALSNEQNSIERNEVKLKGKIDFGERFITQEKSSLMLSLAGASHLKVAEKTRLKVITDREISVEQGKVWLDVGKDDRLFKVSTPFGKVIVFGTIFEVVVGATGTTVTVEEGDVHVENDTGAFSNLLTGEQVEVKRDQKQLTPHNVDKDSLESLLKWARAIKADKQAEKLYKASIQPRNLTIMQAEKIFRIPTEGRQIKQITLNWSQENFTTSGHCGYHVYVYDEKRKPLHKEYIEPAIFSREDRTRYTIEFLNKEVISNKSQLDIEILPDNEGLVETEFTEVFASAT